MSPRLLVLVLFFADAALASPPAVSVGNDFVETFADGFDHPGAAVVAENLEFRDGAAHLLAGGVLEYAFDYSSVDSRWGVREPVFGDGQVEIVDPGDAVFTVTWTVRFLGFPVDQMPPSRIVFSFEGTAGRIELLDPPSGDWPFDVTALDFARTPGRGWIWLFPYDWGMVVPKFVADAAGETQWPSVLWEAQPLSVRIEGEGVAIDAVRTSAYAVVSDASESFGGLKTRFVD